MGFFQFDTQVQVLEHNGLNYGFGPSVCPFLIAEHFLERIQSSRWLSNVNKFCNNNILVSVIKEYQIFIMYKGNFYL